MNKKNNDTKFESIFDEFMYEVQDVIDLLTHVLGGKSTAYSVLDLLNNYSHRPANDNWPLYEKKDVKQINATQT
tara:strand:+ start:352 stop:573 length:222 start_codon:yes stop_codon:yes gene_type:complete